MEINENSKVLGLIEQYPFLMDFLVSYNSKFSALKNPITRNTIGRVATLQMAAGIAGVDVKKLIEDIKAEIDRHKGIEGGDKIIQGEKQERLKEIIRELHNGVPVQEVKKKFNELIKDLDASEIAAMEERLIAEGMPVSEIQRLCDIHVNVFKDLLDKKSPIEVPQNHPLYLYLLENKAISERVSKIQDIFTKFLDSKDSGLLNRLKEQISELQDINYHYLRKENQLFPYLERHNFTGPSQVMWGIHDEIRKKIKDLIKAIESTDTSYIEKEVPSLLLAITEMIYKEENILYPTSLRLLSDSEWEEIKRGEKEIGFSFINVEDLIDIKSKKEIVDVDGLLNLSTGRLNSKQIDCILKTLPVDISFVDENDEVKYYSDTKDRIFPRSPGVIGRKVQKCHPPKSVHIVEKILRAFKENKKDVAEFYIKLNGRDIHIRYFAVRDVDGRYLGTLEVSQDITEIKRLEKEKRLLDWEEK
ncbi:MAG: DUF438 domain-containing protein [Myxococcota bacterium]